MQKLQIPDFNFDSDFIDNLEEYSKEKEYVSFTEGDHTLKLVHSHFKGMHDTNTTFMSWMFYFAPLNAVEIKTEVDDENKCQVTALDANGDYLPVVATWRGIPTKTAIWKSVSGKTNNNVWVNTVKLLTALKVFKSGINLKQIPKFFSSYEHVDNLNGTIVEVVLARTGNYIAKLEDDSFQLVDKKSQPLKLLSGKENKFATKDLAEGEALLEKINLRYGLDMTSIMPSEKQAETTQTQEVVEEVEYDLDAVEEPKKKIPDLKDTVVTEFASDDFEGLGV